MDFIIGLHKALWQKPHGPNCCFCLDAINQPLAGVGKKANRYLYVACVTRKCCKCDTTIESIRLPWKWSAR